jgi:hypothetical protein
MGAGCCSASVMRWLPGWRGEASSLKAPLNAVNTRPGRVASHTTHSTGRVLPCSAPLSMRSPAQPAAQLRISLADPRMPSTQSLRLPSHPENGPHTGRPRWCVTRSSRQSRCSCQFLAMVHKHLRGPLAMKQPALAWADDGTRRRAIERQGLKPHTVSVAGIARTRESSAMDGTKGAPTE